MRWTTLALLMACATPAAASGVAELVASASASVVKVEAQVQSWDPTLARWLGRFGPLPARASAGVRDTVGAGFTVGPDRVVTTLHTVAGARQVRVQRVAGAGLGEAMAARVCAEEPARDVAILCVDGLDAPALRPGPNPRPGDEAVSFGFPNDGGLVVSRGVISGETDRAIGGAVSQRWLLTDAMVRVGHSGGPLLGADGSVLGMIVGGYAEGSSSAGFGLVLPTAALPWVTPTAPAAAAAPLGIAVEEAPALTVGGATFFDAPGGGVRVGAVDDARGAFGLRAGDVLRGVGALDLRDTAELRRALDGSARGVLAALSDGRRVWIPR